MLSEGEISTGDILMVVKNNYFWVDESSPCGFIANGDLAEVMSVRRTEEVYGLHFARVEPLSYRLPRRCRNSRPS